MSFSITPLHVKPYSFGMAPGDVEPLRFIPEQAVSGPPVAKLYNHETGEAASPDPSVVPFEDIYIVTVTAPETPLEAIYTLEIESTGTNGRIWTDRITILVPGV